MILQINIARITPTEQYPIVHIKMILHQINIARITPTEQYPIAHIKN
jgi:hypothetical protein